MKKTRKKKVYPGEVLDYLKIHLFPVPKWKISADFKCSKGTIRNRVRDLRAEGHQIIPTIHGLMYREHIATAEDAQLMKQSGMWNVALIKGLIQIADISKNLLVESQKHLLKNEDKKLLKQTLNELSIITGVPLLGSGKETDTIQ